MKPIFTLEDGTEVLETTGDADAIRYGGGVLYRSPGDAVVWDFWDAPEKNFFVYKADASRHVLDHYEVDVEELVLCAAGEVTEKEILKLSASADPRRRLQVLALIRSGCGASELDPDGPVEMTKFDLVSRWGFLFGMEKDEIEEISQEDYMIREYGQRWECGRVDGLCLGRYTRYDDAIAAVANDMEKVGLITNLFHEHSPGEIELVQWIPEEHIGRGSVIRGKIPAAQWKLAMRRYKTAHKPRRRQRLATSIRRSESMRVGQRNRIERARKIREYLAG
jgi:hypothetical protein